MAANPRTSFLHLPQEIKDMLFKWLLDESSKTPHRDQNNLSRTCRQVYEKRWDDLVKHVIIDIANIGALLEFYFKYDETWAEKATAEERQLAAQIGGNLATVKRVQAQTGKTQTLEIRRWKFPADVLDPDAKLLANCKKFIAECKDIVPSQDEWATSLEHRQFEAYLGILLMLITRDEPHREDRINRKYELRLAHCNLQDLPFLNKLFREPRPTTTAGVTDWVRTRRWTTHFSDEIFDYVAPKLEKLALPNHWALPRTMFQSKGMKIRADTFAAFRELEHLQAPYDALFLDYRLYRRTNDHRSFIRVENLPPKLHSLSITCMPACRRNLVVLFQFLQKMIRKRSRDGVLQELRTVKIWMRGNCPCDAASEREDAIVFGGQQRGDILTDGKRLGIDIRFLDHNDL